MVSGCVFFVEDKDLLWCLFKCVFDGEGFVV